MLARDNTVVGSMHKVDYVNDITMWLPQQSIVKDLQKQPTACENRHSGCNQCQVSSRWNACGIFVHHKTYHLEHDLAVCTE